MQTPILKTERIMLRPLNISDAEHIFARWCADADVAKFMRWTVHKSVVETKEWLELEQKNIETSNYTWGFELLATGELVGSGGLVPSDEKGVYELGYNLAKDMWGKGIATEAAKRMIAFAKELRLPKIFCCYALQNHASERVVQKLGFVYSGEGVYQKFDGTKHKSKEYFLNL